MKIMQAGTIRTRLTLWYVGVLAVILVLYISLVFAFQYVLLERQIFHDEIQDVETVEGLLYFDASGVLHLNQDYHTHPNSHLLEDRLMEVLDPSGAVLYRTDTLRSMTLGGAIFAGEGEGRFNERDVTLSGGERVALISHLHAVHGRVVLIRLGYRLSAFYARMLRFFLLLLIALPVAMLIAGYAGIVIARRALRPLELMAERAAQITASNLDGRLEIQNEHDELGQMAKVINQLLQRLEEAFEQLKRFTADAAHELRSPLAAMRALGEIALQQTEGEHEYREAIGSILEESGKLNQTIEGLLLLAKAEALGPPAENALVFLPELVDEILALLSVLIDDRRLVVIEDRTGLESSRIRADRSLVRAALMNVLHNAVKFSPEGGTLKVNCTTTGELERFAEVSIQDEGPGLAPGEHQQVFERFFTSTSRATASASGTGLGLSIARLAIERNGGFIFFDESLTHGTRCVIRLPLAEQPAAEG